MSLAVGHIVGKRYEITGFLGAGGMGAVYTALDLKLTRHVALKVVKSDSATPDAIERFVLEWLALAKVEHENILRLYDADRDGAQWFFTAELLSGMTLATLLQTQRFHWREAIEISLPLIRALRCVHDHWIVHRDVKPENVFVTKENHVKLLDFGIAKELPEPGSESTGIRTGGGFCTPAFASPEQLGRRDIDLRSDIFSLGILMHLMIAGEHPFDYAWPKILNNQPAPMLDIALAPPDVAAVIHRCLQKDRDLRFGTMAKVEEALRFALAGATLERLDEGEEVDIEDELLTHLTTWNRTVLQDRTYAPFDAQYSLTRAHVTSRIHEFIASDKVFMVIGGKAGTGKSFLVASLPETVPSGTLLWIFDCGTMAWPWDEGMEKALTGSIDDLATALKAKNRALLLVFDGLNESSRRTEFAEQLSTFVRSLTTRHLKVLVTCRVPAWHALRRHLQVPLDKTFQGSGVSGCTELELFDPSEARQAYSLYKSVYGVLTDYDHLSPAVRHFLAHPLFLKLTCEAFEGREIPPVVALHEVFASYVRKCLGDDPARAQDWPFLERIVLVMYEHARREIEVDLLRVDAQIGADVSRGDGSSYAHLLDENLLTQAARSETLLRTTEIVFVTYERVFEFLLAEIVVGGVSAERIALHLDVIRERAFPQLRGALELALSFALVRGAADTTLLIDLARTDRPDSRQFLADVIHTIHDSGHHALVTAILAALSDDAAIESQLVAVHVAYQLGFEERLVDLLVSGKPALRDQAALFLYAAWNRKRLGGDLEGAYRPLQQLRSKISILHLPRSRAALSALTTLCLNLGLHIIDDEPSLYPLIDLLRELVRTLPGLAPDASRGAVARFASNKTGDLLIDVLASVLSSLMIKERVLAGIFDDRLTKRALLDVGHLITIGNLTGHEEKIRTLINWNHPVVAFSSRSILTRHVFVDPATHLPMFEEFLESSDLPPFVRTNVLHAMVYGVVALSLKSQRPEPAILSRLEGWFEEVWTDLTGSNGALERPQLTADDALNAARYVFFGLLFIDAMHQRESGRVSGSRFAERFCAAGIEDRTNRLAVALKALESMGFQGFVEYAVATMLEPAFFAQWTTHAFGAGCDVLASLRSVFQEEVDGMFQDDPRSRSVWDAVRARGGTPDPGAVWEMSYEVWTMVATAVNVTLMKLSGLILLDLVLSSRPAEFLRKAIRTLIAVLFEPERIDIAHVQYGLAHDPGWNLFETLEIAPGIVNVKPDVHDYYRSLSADCVAKLGRGIMYANPDSHTARRDR